MSFLNGPNSVDFPSSRIRIISCSYAYYKLVYVIITVLFYFFCFCLSIFSITLAEFESSKEKALYKK
jgi:hypothetical protein